MSGARHIAVLGGGPAGLAAGHYASRASIDYDVFEASGAVGGNCRTLRFGECLVDTGAHRLHDRDDDMIATARRLLGADLLHVDAPSQIRHANKFLDFPLAPLNIVRRLPARMLATIIRENIALRLRRTESNGSFGSIARTSYGETLASLALLRYSRKLWGCDPDDLLPEIAGSRLARLDLRSFIIESVRGRSSVRKHLDGAFYYPRFGIGQFFDAIAIELANRVHTNAPVTRIAREGKRVVSVRAADRNDIVSSHFVSTLSMVRTVQLLSPAAPEEIVAAARSIRFRQLRLAILVVARDCVSPNASIYFPESDIPFTRLYESKNRSAAMAPKGTTAIVLEVPCESNDRISQLEADGFFHDVCTALEATMGVHTGEILERHEITIPNAYPLLEIATAPSVALVRAYLESFSNLIMVGRNARFEYSSIHNLFADAREAIARIACA